MEAKENHGSKIKPWKRNKTMEAKELIKIFCSKKFALICVNNIIALNPHSNPFYTNVYSTMDYWIEVKKEIEILK